jgi:hypothetical protein
MKSQNFVVAALLVLSTAAAQEPRDDTVRRIETMYMSADVLAPESPFLQIVLGSALEANAGVAPDEWVKVSNEVSLAISQMFAVKGGLVDVAFTASVRDLSDEELHQLERLVSDPVYQKFQKGMSAPQTQRQIMQAMMTSALSMDVVVNEVLSRHGLKEAH